MTEHSVAHIDADSLVYAAGFSTDGQPVENCLHLLNRSVQSIIDAAGAEYYIVYLTGKRNFRDTVVTDYKANRTSRRPEHYAAAREYLQEYWGAVVTDGIEADDAVAIAQTEDSVICSIDKDLLQVPGWHYSWKNKLGVRHVSEEQGLRWFYKQMLMGDRVDNIKGLPKCTEELVQKYSLTRYALRGVGDRTADSLLSHGTDPESWYSIVKECYDTHDSTGEYMQQQANLLWMVRELNEYGEPVLWTPPEVT
jgi:DNA polymerase-1